MNDGVRKKREFINKEKRPVAAAGPPVLVQQQLLLEYIK
jgi:hypothetical protein